MPKSEISDFLEKCELFSGLNRKEVGENLYIIAEGLVVLERSIDLGTRSGNAVIGLLGKGRALGCWSTLLGEPHTLMSSARCRRPTKAVVLRGLDLREMMLGNLPLGFKVLERLCFILRDRIQGAYGAMENV
jgi:CRP/FNR family cyclic AMP-dependent transcriptional regulator